MQQLARLNRLELYYSDAHQMLEIYEASPIGDSRLLDVLEWPEPPTQAMAQRLLTCYLMGYTCHQDGRRLSLW